jgi:hypothetical protein
MLTQAILGPARWVLPWLCVLAVSATLAYATNAAITGGRLVSEASVTISAPAATDTDVDFCAAASSPAQYVGLNNWIPVAPRRPGGCADNLKSIAPN